METRTFPLTQFRLRTPRSVLDKPCAFTHGFLSWCLLWMDKILHYFETWEPICLLVFAEESSFRRILGGAGFRPSTVCKGPMNPFRLRAPKRASRGCRVRTRVTPSVSAAAAGVLEFWDSHLGRSELSAEASKRFSKRMGRATKRKPWPVLAYFYQVSQLGALLPILFVVGRETPN